MSQIKELLVDQMQDLLHAETQLLAALPKMADAAHHPKLKEAFQKHLSQTEGHVERLRRSFELIGEKAEPKPCKAMMGLVAEGEETIKEGKEKGDMPADLALIAAAQRVEHYEISAYGTARALARQLGAIDCARLLTQTLGEEESSDFMLTAIADPIVQQLAIEDGGNGVNLESVPSGNGKDTSEKRKKTSK